VLYNIGLVSAAMGRPVEAVDALDKVLATPGSLAPDRVERARQTRDDQASRIAKVTVVTNVPAEIEIDNVVAGHAPMTAPLRVAGGLHVVGAVASGYAPVRKELTVAGGTAAELRLDLVEMQGRVAHVTIKTHLPGADVVIDDQVVGKTPLPESLTVVPGPHEVELRRAGYVTARQDLQLGDGASGEAILEPEEDHAALGASAATLSIRSTEPDPVLTVDGKERGVARADGVRLAPGPHHLVIEHGGFLPVERDVTLDAGRITQLAIVFEPTPETRAAYQSRISTQRTWGLALGGGGIVLTGGSIGFLVWNGQQRTQATSDSNAALNEIEHPPKGTICDKAMFTSPQAIAACNQPYQDAQSRIDDANTRDIFGWIGFGVGVTATVVGAALLVTNGSSHRFDRDRPVSKAFVVPVGWGDGRHGGGFGLAGAF
ncbi:MAG TPA: PEGA domain-containing protein, partial [Polyangiaceae bacterium]